MGNSLLSQEDYWCVTSLTEEKLHPMHVAIECNPRPCLLAVMHRTDYFQSAQLVEAIVGINKFCSAWLLIWG